MKTHQLISSDPASRIAESYRLLRTNIQFASLDNPVKTILLTSTAPGEGKSTTTANLAIAFAQTGKKVVLVDADLRRPTQHKIFGITNQIGLSNVLKQNVALKAMLRDVGVENLQLITSGPIPTNPAEALGTSRMQDFLRELSQGFDHVLIDSPPTLAVADSTVLCRYVDGVILVVATNEVSADKIQKATNQLANSKANIIGAVLNGAEYDSREEYYYVYGDRKAK